MRLRALVVVTNTDAAIGSQAVGPESADGGGSVRHGIVGEEEPEAEDGLGKDIKDGVGDDLTVDLQHTGTIGNAPDAVTVRNRACGDWTCTYIG